MPERYKVANGCRDAGYFQDTKTGVYYELVVTHPRLWFDAEHGTDGLPHIFVSKLVAALNEHEQQPSYSI